MARMHAKRKGRSGSRRPPTQENPSWVPLSASEVEDLVLRLRQQGHPAAEIGTILRDSYGVPSVKLATGRSVLAILRERDRAPDLPEDLANLMRRAIGLQAHLADHPKDLHNRRGLQLVEAKIRRLARYYKEAGVLPPGWEYSLGAAELQVK